MRVNYWLLIKLAAAIAFGLSLAFYGGTNAPAPASPGSARPGRPCNLAKDYQVTIGGQSYTCRLLGSPTEQPVWQRS